MRRIDAQKFIDRCKAKGYTKKKTIEQYYKWLEVIASLD